MVAEEDASSSVSGGFEAQVGVQGQEGGYAPEGGETE